MKKLAVRDNILSIINNRFPSRASLARNKGTVRYCLWGGIFPLSANAPWNRENDAYLGCGPEKHIKLSGGKYMNANIVLFFFPLFCFLFLTLTLWWLKRWNVGQLGYIFGNRNIRSMAVKKLLFKSHLMTISFHRVRQYSIIIYFVYLSRRVRQTRDSHNLAQSYQQIGEIGHED